jgi:dinuclear metal center YbgI/SA1388 family protein
MIIAHHPLIFHKIGKIDYNNITGKYITELIRAGISVYSAHTSFDSVYGGNNDYLAELLGLQKIRRFQPNKEPSSKELSNDIGKIGDLKHEMRFGDVCLLVKERLKIDHSLAVVGDPDSMIKKVGLCTGGGGDLIEEALRNGCSLFITSDIRHHEAFFAKESGICAIDAGHYNTEIIFVRNFVEKLRAVAGDLLEIYECTKGEEPFNYV